MLVKGVRFRCWWDSHEELFYCRDKWWYGFERGWKLRVEIEDMETIFVKVVAEVMWAKHHCHVSWSHVSKVITVTATIDIIMEHYNKGTEGVSKYICKFTIIPMNKIQVRWSPLKERPDISEKRRTLNYLKNKISKIEKRGECFKKGVQSGCHDEAMNSRRGRRIELFDL